MTTRQLVERLGLTVLALSSTAVLPARQAAAIPDSLFEGLSWRPIGPMRGGRTCAVAGHRAHPFTFYIGVCNGGVWKTDRCRHHLDCPSSTISRRSRSARWRSRHRIRTSSTSAAAKGCTGPTSRSATACTAPRTPARRGRISVCAMRSRSPRSPSIRATPIACSSRCSVIRTVRTRERGIYRSTDGGRTLTQVFTRGEDIGRARRGHRPIEPGRRLCDVLGRSPGPVGERGVERDGRRRIQIDRRRRHLAAS